MEFLESESEPKSKFELLLELVLQFELELELELELKLEAVVEEGATCAVAAPPLFGSSEKGCNTRRTWLSLTSCLSALGELPPWALPVRLENINKFVTWKQFCHESPLLNPAQWGGLNDPPAPRKLFSHLPME